MPFPIINTCENSPGRQGIENDCNIVTDSALNITCSVHEYFPSIDLFFRHTFVKVALLTQREWNNTDGTRNKSVTITALPSDDPYFCVASDIPGADGLEQETQIHLFLPSPSSTATNEETTLTTEPEGSDSSGGGMISEHISFLIQEILISFPRTYI